MAEFHTGADEGEEEEAEAALASVASDPPDPFFFLMANDHCVAPPPPTPQSIAPADVQHLVASAPHRLWHSGHTLRIFFMRGASPWQKRRVMEVVVQWSEIADIYFEQVETIEEAEITVSFDERLGSWSAVGRDSDIDAKVTSAGNMEENNWDIDTF